MDGGSALCLDLWSVDKPVGGLVKCRRRQNRMVVPGDCKLISTKTVGFTDPEIVAFCGVVADILSPHRGRTPEGSSHGDPLNTVVIGVQYMDFS